MEAAPRTGGGAGSARGWTTEQIVDGETKLEAPMFIFERLEVWQKAIEFADLVYSVTKSFPDNERFGLTNQMRRAAVSVSSNLAEGSSRFSNADFVRFLEIGTGSLFEVVSQAFIGRRQGFLTEPEFQQLYAAAEEQGRMLSGLRKSKLAGAPR
jgi:four helix bundle protein